MGDHGTGVPLKPLTQGEKQSFPLYEEVRDPFMALIDAYLKKYFPADEDKPHITSVGKRAVSFFKGHGDTGRKRAEKINNYLEKNEPTADNLLKIAVVLAGCLEVESIKLKSILRTEFIKHIPQKNIVDTFKALYQLENKANNEVYDLIVQHPNEWHRAVKMSVQKNLYEQVKNNQEFKKSFEQYQQSKPTRHENLRVNVAAKQLSKALENKSSKKTLQSVRARGPQSAGHDEVAKRCYFRYLATKVAAQLDDKRITRIDADTVIDSKSTKLQKRNPRR